MAARVEVLEPGKLVRVHPEEPDGYDVLEYAQALIEEEGWNPNPAEGASSTTRGWTLHDAVGEANRRLFGGNKEGHYGRQGTTRVQATEAIKRVLPEGIANDMIFNDEAKDVSEVLALLARAREGAST